MFVCVVTGLTDAVTLFVAAAVMVGFLSSDVLSVLSGAECVDACVGGNCIAVSSWPIGVVARDVFMGVV